MGNSRAFRHACALAAIAGLTACDSAPRMWTRDEIQDIADDSFPYQDNNTRLTMELQARVIELERKVDMQERDIRALGTAQDSLLQTVNHNADVANSNARLVDRRAGIAC